MRILIPLAALAVALTGLTAVPAKAQSGLEGRVDRLEREMRAVQRKVFPGGAGRVVTPDITPTDGPTPGSPISGPVTNLEQRITALEGQLSTVTGQVEQTQYRLQQLEQAFQAYKRSTDARLKAIEDTLTSTGGAGSATGTKAPPPKADADTDKPVPAKKADAGSTDTDKKAGSGSRADQIAAVEKPDSGDAAEDKYVYGYRLWRAKLYPEARKELAGVVSKYPDNRRASYAQNLIGRAYFDEGKYQEAAKAFYENYVKMPSGERAADSLYYLSKTLQKLKAAPKEICKVYSAIDTEYSGKMSIDQQADIDRGKTEAKCK